MNPKSNRKKLHKSSSDEEKLQDIQGVINYFLSEGIVVETRKGYYRLKTNQEIKKEIADICNN